MKYKRLVVIILICIFCLGSLIPAYASTRAERFKEYEDREHIWGEKMLSKVVTGLGLGLEKLLLEVGISIDSVVFNDDSGLPSGTQNKIAFSFDKDNVFGGVSLGLYGLFRNVALVFMLPILSALGIRVWLKPSTANSLAWKDSLLTYVITFLLIFIMPTLLSFAQQLVVNIARGFQTSEGLTFIEELAKNAKSEYLIDAILYAGAVGLTAWFGAMYAYRNIILVFLVMFFPIFAMTLNSERFKQGYEGWLKEVGSVLMIPLVDAALLLAITKVIQMGVGGFISLILASAIIPVRGKLRQLMGLSSGGMSEMMGFAALNGVSGLVKSGSKGLKNGISGMSEGYGDIKEANKYGKASENLNSESNSSSGLKGVALSQGMSSTYSPSSNMNTGELLSGPPADSDLATPTSTSTEYNQTRRDLTIPLKGPKAGEDMYSYNLKRQGQRKFMKAGASMAMAGLGGLGVGSLASMQGMAAMTHGAQIGGHIGDMAGTAIGIGASNLQDRYYDEKHGEKSEQEVEQSQSERINPIRVPNVDGYENTSYESIAKPSVNTQFQGLPQGVGMNQQGEYTFENMYNDMDNNIDDNAKQELRRQAYESAIVQTGIDPKMLQNQYQEEVNRLYNQEIQQKSNKGESITVDVENSAMNNAHGQAQINLRSKEQASHFSQVANINYEGLLLQEASANLQKSGYSSNILEQYDSNIRNQLKETLEMQVYEMNVEEDLSVDDII